MKAKQKKVPKLISKTKPKRMLQRYLFNNKDIWKIKENKQTKKIRTK
jgi:hypothetical protein